MIRGVLAYLLVVLPLLAADYIWVEAESGTKKLENSNDWYDPVDRKTSLSGGDWWHSFDEKDSKTGFVDVPFKAPDAGSYHLWVRLNLSSTGYNWRLNNGKLVDLPVQKWREEARKNEWNYDYKRRIFDETYVSHDGSNRHRLAWVSVGDVKLTAGDHLIRFKVGRGKHGKGFAAVDCFVLAKAGFRFRPRMFYKPGQRVKVSQEIDSANAWVWPDVIDNFAKTPIDLSYLNEKVAGASGFIKLSSDGNGFVRGDGKPIRFWGGSDYNWREPFRDDDLSVSKEEAARVEHHARWSAKRGINMVRFHGHLPAKRKRGGKPTKREDINKIDLHGAWYMVAAFKKHGIYSTISPYWGSHTDNDPGWNLGFKGGNLSGLVFFYPPVQEMYRNWVKRLYTEKNPYTGIPLSDDPALAIIQLQNEDSLLFYTAGSINGEPLRVLTKKFGDFAAAKHGSIEKALALYKTTFESSWDLRGKDDAAVGTVGVLQNWFFTLDAKNRANKWQNQAIRARLDDQLAFFAKLMRDWNVETARYLREELGCKQLINAGNWKSVDPTAADDVERWSYTGNEVIGKNAYYTGIHNGINNGWQILRQHVYTNWSSLKRPRFWPMNIKQIKGHPMIIPESLWVPPNLYASESSLVVASQLSLTGVDVFYWFCTGATEWAPINNKWPYSTPMQMGQFPATALAFRKGYIAEAKEPVVYEERSLDDLWKQRAPLIAESPVYDPNRDTGEMPTTSQHKTAVDPLAFCVGPVQVKYGGNAANNKVSPKLSSLIDTEKKMLTSVTGQIMTDYGRGIYTVNAPKIQAAAGFLKQQPVIALSDVTIRSKNDYATIVVVTLDDEAIARSSKLLVQVGTKARPTGWIVRERNIQSGKQFFPGYQIMQPGTAPLQIANTEIEIDVKNAAIRKAVALDINGNPMKQRVTVRRQGNKVTVALPKNAMYTVLSTK